MGEGEAEEGELRWWWWWVEKTWGAKEEERMCDG